MRPRGFPRRDWTRSIGGYQMRSRLMSAFGTTVPDCLYPEVPEVRRVGINTNDTNEAMKADVVKGVDVDNDPKSNPTNDDNTSNIDNTNSIRDKNSTANQPNNHTCFACEKLRQQFADWRNAFTISDAKQRCRLVRPGYSCGVLSSGGLLCTMAAIRSGFVPRWGTEINETMQKMWSDLTNTASLGDTFKTNCTQQQRIIYLKSGQPCPDYSSSHAGSNPPGSSGDTGWQFVAQTDKIKEIKPTAFMIEMVANALRVNDGADVETVLTSLQGEYHLHSEVVAVAGHGDCSNRQRLFIVGFCKDRVGDMGTEFSFPTPQFHSGNSYTAADVAVPDEAVPNDYWLYEDIDPFTPTPTPKPLCIHKIAQCAPGMGPSWRPHAVQTHAGIYPCQTTHNGGGRRVPLRWQEGDPIDKTRVTVPTEAGRIANLPDEYIGWVRTFDDSDEFLFKAINMGIPLRTATAIDHSVHDLLVRAGIDFDITADDVPESAAGVDTDFDASMATHKESWVGLMRHIRSIQLDTGANGTFMYSDIEPNLDKKETSSATKYCDSGSKQDPWEIQRQAESASFKCRRV